MGLIVTEDEGMFDIEEIDADGEPGESDMSSNNQSYDGVNHDAMAGSSSAN